MTKKNTSYKDTLNLPKTAFDMRANLLKKEPDIQARWRESRLYETIRRARKGSPRFVLHDGPPYANGNIHMGTALNKVLKDIVVRIKNMTGMDSPYLPGWDCHGLPIEAKVMEELGDKALTMEPLTIRRICSKYAEKFVALQSEQFQRLGVMGEFDDPYITMQPRYETAVLEVFARLVEQGVVYKQLKPVHWSIENRTALADAELEYEDRQDPSIYVALPVVPDSANPISDVSGDETLFLVIWTTTPWTLPANEAVAINPNLKYVMAYVEVRPHLKWKFLVASERYEFLEKKLKELFPDKSIKRHPVHSGSRWLSKKLRYVHPLIKGKTCPVVGADYVSVEDGTGLVHIAPGHGTEDYYAGLENNLNIYCPVQADGTFDETVPEWLRGQSVWDSNDQIIEELAPKAWNWEEGKKIDPPGNPPPMVLGEAETITHSYPHDWRSKTPTIFRATEQWFIGVDTPLGRGGKSQREMGLEACGVTADKG